MKKRPKLELLLEGEILKKVKPNHFWGGNPEKGNGRRTYGTTQTGSETDEDDMEIMVEDRETSTNLIDCGRKFWGAVNDGGGAKSKSKDDKTAEANARTSVTK